MTSDLELYAAAIEAHTAEGYALLASLQSAHQAAIDALLELRRMVDSGSAEMALIDETLGRIPGAPRPWECDEAGVDPFNPDAEELIR